MAALPAVIALGEVLVEIMRPDVSQPLDEPGTFLGPFASGAPAIFAVAAARLGLAAGFIGAVGDDAFGRLLRARLAREGVEHSQLQTVAGRSTAVAFVAYDGQGKREFVFHLRHAAAGALAADALGDSYFRGARWLHLSGSTLALNENSRAAAQRALDLVLAGGGALSFDPNLRPELLPLEDARRLLAPFIAAATLLLPTGDEARALTGRETTEKAANALLAQGPQLVAVKEGAAGAALYSRRGAVTVAGIPVRETDPTGAGDSFNAACIYGLEQGWPLRQVARFAVAAGALAVTRQGPMEGAPALAAVEALMAGNPDNMENDDETDDYWRR